MLASIHRKAYKAPPVRRVWIPKPGKAAKRPLGVPCVADRALQRSVSVVLSSNIYLHYVLDLWFEKVLKPKLKGEAYLVRYIDDFVVCFQLRSDAIRFQDALVERFGKFSLELEPKKTRLVEFGRFALRMAKERGKRLETIYFLGFTHFCTRNRKGNFMVGHKTEKS
jgi:RNA-directed DNA polymerase